MSEYVAAVSERIRLAEIAWLKRMLSRYSRENPPGKLAAAGDELVKAGLALAVRLIGAPQALADRAGRALGGKP